MEQELLIFIGIFFLLHILRTIYSALKYRNKIDSENTLIYVSTFTIMVVMWIIWFKICEIDSNKIRIPDYLKYFGLLLFIVGIILFVISMIQLKGVENIDHLVTNGVYSRFRHPMYLAMILWIVGYPLFQESKYALLTSVIWIINILIWRYFEEKELSEKYDEYKTYKKLTLF